MALTQAVDLAPTLAEWFGASLPDAHGHSLLPLARGQCESIRTYACSGLQVGAMREYALRTTEWAYLLPHNPGGEDSARTARFYIKPDDREEVNDVVQHHLEFADNLERTLRAFLAATGQTGPLQAPPLPQQDSGVGIEDPALKS